MNGRAMSRQKPNFFRNTRGADCCRCVCEERPPTRRSSFINQENIIKTCAKVHTRGAACRCNNVNYALKILRKRKMLSTRTVVELYSPETFFFEHVEGRQVYERHPQTTSGIENFPLLNSLKRFWPGSTHNKRKQRCVLALS